MSFSFFLHTNFCRFSPPFLNFARDLKLPSFAYCQLSPAIA
jgi:hypothetical protein